MKFTPAGIEQLDRMLNKMERYFAFKYEVSKESIAFVIKGRGIHVLVNGKMKESIMPQGLEGLGIREETGELKGPPRSLLSTGDPNSNIKATSLDKTSDHV